MAPRSMFSRSNAPARPHTRSSKPKAFVHMSKMFKNHAQHSKSSRTKAAPVTKYSLTSKPHGVVKAKSRRHSYSTLRDHEMKRQKRLEHPLSNLFNDTSTAYRTTLIDRAQTALSATRRALLTRLTTTNGPAPRRTDHPGTSTSSASTPDLSEPDGGADDRPSSPSTRVPTAAELQASHNALVASMTAPLGEHVLVRRGEDDSDGALVEQDGSTLGASMDGFAAVVVREEERLRVLGEEWGQVVAEIRLLGESVFGKGVVRGMVGGKADGVVEGRTLGEEELDALRRMVEDGAKEEMEAVEELEDGERKARRVQVRNLRESFAMMEDM